MNLEQRISGLARMGNALAALLEEVEFSGRVTGNLLHDVLRRAYSKNPWFTPENSVRALKSISDFLGQSALETWLSGYKGFQKVNDEPLSIGLVMAGNLPAVGFLKKRHLCPKRFERACRQQESSRQDINKCREKYLPESNEIISHPA